MIKYLFALCIIEWNLGFSETSANANQIQEVGKKIEEHCYGYVWEEDEEELWEEEEEEEDDEEEDDEEEDEEEVESEEEEGEEGEEGEI